MVERTLQIMIEICADIANHIIADKGYRIPRSYADTFRVLYEKGIIEEEIFKMMENMAKFRNIVVHRYDQVDEYIVINILKKHLNDFLVYRNVILNTLSQN
ncbi:MAG: HepT-like ribonuclease domain-containing protein [Planctomycetota bacterium]